MSRTFEIGGGCLFLDDAPFAIFCGEIHASRVPRPYWRHRLEMARAMGLNTVCLYLFWNWHEAEQDRFDFEGERDVAAFCREAQDLGLWVIVRPGPYSCAEWDWGGLPAWLLRDPDLRIRCSYPGFLHPALRYLSAVADQLVPLQINHGGPILMIQVENEYGVYGNDRTYMETLRDHLRSSGFDVPLMRCDWASAAQIVPGAVGGDVVTVANFGSKAEENIHALARLVPGQPRMCGEFWMGWFDWWGHPRNGADFEDGAKHKPELQWMLDNEVSFSMYMFHGGTNFGFNAGANCQDGRYDPYVTSYDFFAPVDEQGRPRPKYFRFRNMIAATTGRVPPEPPESIPVTLLPSLALTESASLLESPSWTRREIAPLTMEVCGQSHGALLYTTDLQGRAAGTARLRVKDVHDFAWVYLNGSLLGTLDRHAGRQEIEVTIPESGPARLEILVEAMGRVNFGPTMPDERKGITRRVEHGWLTLFDWEIAGHPLDAVQLDRLEFCSGQTDDGRPRFHRGWFDRPGEGDLHLDLRGWGKGMVWINRRSLGRYWSIGPQQTLYLPGVWLQERENEIIVLDYFPPTNAGSERTIAGIESPILNEVQPA